VNTPTLSALQQMLEPVWQQATHVYNASTAGRLAAGSAVEGLLKQGDVMGKPQTRPGLHETVQSTLAKPLTSVEAVQAQMFQTGDFQGVTGV
jgi:hypothetical protein